MQDARAVPVRDAVFAQLKPLCTELLLLRCDACGLASCLAQLREVLLAAPAAGLQACMDYVLFPLLFIVDAIPLTRQARGGGATGQTVKGKESVPAAQSDRVAEAVLLCCDALLAKSKPQTGEQLINLLERFAALLDLPRTLATEEVRSEALSCLSALLVSPSTSAGADLAVEATAPLVGFLSSLMLRVADEEAQAGQQGSRALRAAALHCLRLLINEVADRGSAATLAFLVPGVVSGLCRALMAAGTSHGPNSRSGAAAGTAAAVEALQTLTALLCAVLGADSNGLAPKAGGRNGHEEAGDAGLDRALAALQQMDFRMKSGMGQVSQNASAPLAMSGAQGLQPGKRKFQVQRDVAWVKATSLKIQERLAEVLPPLLDHPRPAVRIALAEGVVELLTCCRDTLAASSETLLELLYTLAQDEWPQVAAPCLAFLSSSAAVNSKEGAESAAVGGLSRTAIVTVVARLVKGLPGSLQTGEEAGVLHARRLVTALQAAGHQHVSGMLRNPVQLSTICRALLQSLAFDRIGASLLLFASSGTGAQASSRTAPNSSGAKEAASDLEATQQQSGLGSTAAEPSGTVEGTTQQGVVLLPRMPMGLALMASSRTYEAVAAICRTLGRLAAQAGGHALRSLADHLLTELRTPHPQAPGGERSAGAGSSDWQCTAASTVTVLSEVIYGASAAWKPSGWLASADVPADNESKRAELEVLVAMLLEEVVQAPLWGVRTYNSPRQGDGDVEHLTPQALGENAILVRALLDAIGVAARAVGPPFSEPGTQLRVVLLPLLERLGDPSPSVAAATSDALASICLHCGYTGLQDLVAQNLDYIVDGVCLQLRNLDAHPRAPFLFAVLLRKAGVAPALLPLLAEPARASVRGLAITARRKRPAHIAAYLAALKEIVAGCALDATTILADTQQVADSVQQEIGRRRDALDGTLPRAPDSFIGHKRPVEGSGQAESSGEPGGGPEQDAAALQDVLERTVAAAEAGDLDDDAGRKAVKEAEEYFRRHHEQKKRAQEEAAHADADADDDENGEESRLRVVWGEEEWATAESRRQRIHAIATIASAALEASAQLLASQSLQVVLLAVEVCLTALQALQSTSASLNLLEYKITPYLQKKGIMEPVAPDTPQLLPHVHVFWGPLVAALKDARIVVVECALRALGELANLSGGDFLARRTAKEAWPVLARLMREGPSVAQLSRGGPLALTGGAEPSAPAVIHRARQAVLESLKSVSSSNGKAALRDVVAAAAEASAPYISNNEPPAVRTAARQVLMQLAQMDVDAVWLLLVRVASQGGDAAWRPPMNPSPQLLAPLAEIFPRHGTKLPMLLAKDCSTIALVMLPQVEKLTPVWHSQAVLQSRTES